MNIDLVNGVTVTEDVNLRRCRVHNKGGCAGILAALSVHGGLLAALSVCGRLLSTLNVRDGLFAVLVIHGSLLEWKALTLACLTMVDLVDRST